MGIENHGVNAFLCIETAAGLLGELATHGAFSNTLMELHQKKHTEHSADAKS